MRPYHNKEDYMLSKHLTMILLGSALVSAPALAQTSGSTTSGSGSSTTMSSGSTSGGSMSSGNWMTQEQPGQWRASKLEGLDVYNNNNEKVGDISEVLVDQSGKIQAVVIGVGGFLGMGEHSVAVPFEQIKFVNEPRANASAANTTTTGTAGMSGTSAGTTGSSNMTTANNTAAGTNATPNTTGSVASNNAAGSDTMNRSAPDHAMLDMTKDQLKAAPEFKYNR
jgi:sporulation protein YlmC with PRC-barrel domain